LKPKHKNVINVERLKEILADLTLFDDIFMSQGFDNNIPAANLLLRVILGKKDIKVISVTGQKEFSNPLIGGRNLKLDILAEDSEGKHYNVEVQRSTAGADERRARFHSSMLDVRMLKSGQKFKKLADSYVIFITEKDFFGENLPIYTIDRMVKETKKDFYDGSHIYYVNGAYQGEDEVGKLMHDFREKKVENMYNKELADSVRHFKKKGDGKVMSSKWDEFVKDMQKEAVKEAMEKAERKLEKEKKEASLLATVTSGIAYGVEKEQIIERLCKEFKLTNSAAEKKYEKYAVKMA